MKIQFRNLKKLFKEKGYLRYLTNTPVVAWESTSPKTIINGQSINNQWLGDAWKTHWGWFIITRERENADLQNKAIDWEFADGVDFLHINNHIFLFENLKEGKWNFIFDGLYAKKVNLEIDKEFILPSEKTTVIGLIDRKAVFKDYSISVPRSIITKWPITYREISKAVGHDCFTNEKCWMFIQHGAGVADESININKLKEEAEKSFGEVLFKKFIENATPSYSGWDDYDYGCYY